MAFGRQGYIRPYRQSAIGHHQSHRPTAWEVLSGVGYRRIALGGGAALPYFG